ncbi:MAG: ATP-binding protein [Muribaculaceae bacterium]
MENANVSKLDVSHQRTVVMLETIMSELKTKSFADYKSIAPCEMQEVCNRLHITRRQVLLVAALIDSPSANFTDLAVSLNCDVFELLNHHIQMSCLQKLNVVDDCIEYSTWANNHYDLSDDFVEKLIKSGVREYVDPAKCEGYLDYLDIALLYLRFEDESMSRKEFVNLVAKISRNRRTIMDKMRFTDQELVFAVVAQARMECCDSECLRYDELSALYTLEEYNRWLKRVKRSKKLSQFFGVTDGVLSKKNSVFAIVVEPEDPSHIVIDLDEATSDNTDTSDSISFSRLCGTIRNEEDEDDEDNDINPFSFDLWKKRSNQERLLTKIDYTKIRAVNMFYSASNEKEINNLTAMLTEDRYKSVLERLEKADMRRGITIVLNGLPGTGKTETVLQLGRLTGRDIYHVDISAIRGMYVGDNERNIKALFDEYAEALKQSDIHPILLFNEADSLLGARCQDQNMRSADRGENSMQNIILEQLESFEGILIATTNMVTNFDKAFERRFLFKVNIDKPSPDIRAKIWEGMIVGLDSDTALRLAEKYDFSGGQIENIARKVIISQVLSGNNEINQSELCGMCDNELLQKINDRKPIGFVS